MKIFCIGRNYVEHARELGNEVPAEPVVFMKPSTALVRSNKPVFYPDFTHDLHYEGELVLRISRNGKRIQPRFARKYFDAVTVGFDLTARDLQATLKAKGLPWEVAKGFDQSAPVGRFLPAESAMTGGEFHYSVLLNGNLVQQGDTSLMIYRIERLISHLSTYFTLQKGDLIFTGTPSGVGPLKPGDELTGLVGREEVIRFTVK